MPHPNRKDQIRPSSSSPSIPEQAPSTAKQSPQVATVISSEGTFYKDAADRIRSRLTSTLQCVVEIGRDLIAVKDRLGHGNFLSWIDREFKMSEKSAERYMAIANWYRDEFDSVSNLSLTALYELAAPSTPEQVRSEVANRAAAGELVTAAEVRALKNQIKERDDKLRVQKKASEIEKNVHTRDLQERDARIRDLGQQLANLREQGESIDHEPLKAALLAIWDMTPKEVKSWFLEVVGRDPPNVASNNTPSAGAN